MSADGIRTDYRLPPTDRWPGRTSQPDTDVYVGKTVHKRGPEWDVRLPFVLFAYCACQQSPTMESPFFFLYGQDPHLPTLAIRSPKESRVMKDTKDYRVELYSRMSEA